ncbi:MAG TPA: VOC family protein [Planctomycetia bacterium]|nr:VOC family protein [Planctomycetia bacterium]
MSGPATATVAAVIPGLRYRDPAVAVDWLCEAFGFEKHAVYYGEDGQVGHAQLRFGNGMVMLGPIVDNEYGRLIRQPEEIGGFETQSSYLVVDDADVVYARAKAAGATIVIDIKDESYGGRAFSCRDLEGRLWNVGTYDPWTA